MILSPRKWETRPINRTCEVRRGREATCDLPTAKAYPAHGGGWMALCHEHGLKHDEATQVKQLLARGERLTPE